MRASESGSLRRARLGHARLYLICDSRPGGRELGTFLAAAVRGGVDLVQLRDKRLRRPELIAAARAAAGVCRQEGALFLVNDDPHAALAAGADGVHVGQHDRPVEEVRALVGADVLVGLSTHSRPEVDEATALRSGGQHVVDYIGVGPVFATPTKPRRAAVGVGLVRYAAARAEIPFFAIGGIHAENIREPLAAGARRVAVVRAIALAEDPERAARVLRDQLEEVTDEHPRRSATAA